MIVTNDYIRKNPKYRFLIVDMPELKKGFSKEVL